jgi:hypothetical protein
MDPNVEGNGGGRSAGHGFLQPTAIMSARVVPWIRRKIR